MESCNIVNRYCIKTAVIALHNQLQSESANMSSSMVKRQLFYKVCVCKIPRFVNLKENFDNMSYRLDLFTLIETIQSQSYSNIPNMYEYLKFLF